VGQLRLGEEKQKERKHYKCGPMPNVMTAMPNTGGALCSTPQSLADSHYPRYTLTPQISSRSVYSVALCWQKITIFAFFWTSAFSGVANWQQCEKAEHGCTTTNLPLSNGIKIVSVLKRLHGEIRRTISDVQKRDKQTDKKTDKKLNVFRRPEGG